MKLAAKVEPNVQKLQILQEVGFKYVEVYTSREIVDNPQSGVLLKEYPFEYIVHAPVDYFDGSVIDFACSINAKLINTHKIITDEMLSSLVRQAKKKGITITVENEAFPEAHHLDDNGKQLPTIKTYDPIRSGGDFLRLQEKIPGVCLCVDVEHAMIRKEYPNIIDSCYEFLRHVHLCGYKGLQHHRPIYENRTLVEHVTSLLRWFGYRGYVVAEHDVEFHTRRIWAHTLKQCGEFFDT